MSIPFVDFSDGVIKIVVDGRMATLTVQERANKGWDSRELQAEVERKLGRKLARQLAFRVGTDGVEYVRVGDISGPWPDEQAYR